VLGHEVRWETEDHDYYTQHVVFRGTLGGVNNALSSLSYSPPADFTGLDAVTVTVADDGHFGGAAEAAKSQLSAQRVIKVFVAPVADKPVIALRTEVLALAEGSTAPYYVQNSGDAMVDTERSAGSTLLHSYVPVPLSAIVAGISDRDASHHPTSVLRLSCLHCSWTYEKSDLTVSAYRPGSAHREVAGADSSFEEVLFLAGDLADLNAALAAVNLAPNVSVDTVDTLTVSVVTDLEISGSGVTYRVLASVHSELQIVGRTRKPTLSSTGPVSMLEDTPFSAEDKGVFKFTSDPSADHLTCRVTLAWSSVALEQVSCNRFQPTLTVPESAVYEVACGQVQPLLDSLVFTPAADANLLNTPASARTLEVIVAVPTTLVEVAETRLDTVIAVASLHIKPMWDITQILFNGREPSGLDQGSVLLYGLQGNPIPLSAISLVDPDEASKLIELNMTCEHGGIAFAGDASSTGHAVRRGTLATLNVALSSAVYSSRTAQGHGTDMLVVSVRRAGSGDPWTSASFPVTVQAVNAPPVLKFRPHTPGSVDIVVAEGSTTAVFNYTVSDPDTPYLSLTLAVSHGRVGFDGELAEWGQSVTINSTAAEITAAVQNLRYLAPHLDALSNSPVEGAVTVTVLDGSENGVTSEVRRVFILPVDNAPTIVVPSEPLPCSATAPAKLGSIIISDSDSSKLSVTVSVPEEHRAVGVLKVTGRAPVQVLQQTDHAVTYQGALAAHKVALANTAFQPLDGDVYLGPVHLTVTASDAAGSAVGSIVTADVSLLVEPSVLVGALSAVPLTVLLEDSPAVTVAALFSVGGYAKTAVLEVSLTASAGCYNASAPELRPYLLGAVDDTVCNDTLLVQGTVSDLMGVVFPSVTVGFVPDFHGLVTVRGTADIRGDGTTDTATAEGTVQIVAVNDAPTITILPAAYSGGDHSNLTLVCTEGVGCAFSVQISDVDTASAVCADGTGQFTVELNTTVVNATLSLVRRDGVKVVQNTTQRLLLSCFVSVYHDSPLELMLLPSADWFGEGTVTVVVSDGGSCGAGGSQGLPLTSAPVTMPVVVTPVDHPPTAAFAAEHVICVEDTACPLPLFTLTDSDHTQLRQSLTQLRQSLTVVLTARHGELVFPDGVAAAEGLTVARVNTSTLNVTGTDATAVANFVNTIAFQPAPDFYGVWVRFTDPAQTQTWG
jgi:hypothetical protein